MTEKIWKKFSEIIEKIEKKPLSFGSFLLAFSVIILIRILGEWLVLGFPERSVEFATGSALVAFLFFLFSFVLLVIYLALISRKKPKQIANVLLYGFLVVIFPPLLDRIICGSADACRSFYLFAGPKELLGRFFMFFGNSPNFGITYGVRIEVALAVIFLFFYLDYSLKSAKKAFLGALGAYAILFILGSFPSFFAFFLYNGQKSSFAIQGVDIAGIFLSPIRYFSYQGGDILNALNAKMNLIYGFFLVPALLTYFFLFFRKKTLLIAKNIRFTQIFVHIGMVSGGFAFGLYFFPQNLTIDFFSALAFANLVLSGVFAWIASVLLNDIEDLEIDKLTNKNRPLAQDLLDSQEYKDLFSVFFALSFLLALSVGVKFAFIAVSYQAIAWLYSNSPFRLKRFPGIATFVSALALLLFFLAGFMLVSDNQSIAHFPGKLFWLLAIALTVSLPIKDLKDIEGDRQNGVMTIPVLLGERWARFAIGFGIFASYGASIIVLNAKAMFLPAMFTGALSFWILQTKIGPRRVHIFVFAVFSLFALSFFYLLLWPVIRFNAL